MLYIAALTLVFSDNVFANTKTCEINITYPPDQSTVPYNNEPSEEDSFTFTVAGTVSNLGNNVICLYQKVSSDSYDWYRSGKPIKNEALGPKGRWSSAYASCGKKNSPHTSCLVKAVVQPMCIDGGLSTPEIGNSLCSTQAYTFKPRHKAKRSEKGRVESRSPIARKGGVPREKGSPFS
jgi:hypothetical protein